MTKIYLDNCALNRPFDDQSQERIRLETEAVVLLLSRVERKEWTWLGSEALEIEIDRTPDADQRLKRVVKFVHSVVEITDKVLIRASELQAAGFVGFDAIHLACAERGKADVFLTTDDRLLKAAKRLSKKLLVKVENPLDWMKENIE